MRILLVSREFPPQTARGGIGTQTHAKADGLSRLGHDVIVLSQSADGQRREVSSGPVRVIRIPGLTRQLNVYTTIAEWLTYSTAVAIEIDALMKKQALDVIDFPEWAAEGYVYLLNRTRWNHAAVAVQLHGPVGMIGETIGWPEPDSELYRSGTAMEAACLRLADRVYSSSARSTAWCATHYGLDVSNVPTIFTGVDTDVFAPGKAKKSQNPSIVFAARITKAKGAEDLVSAGILLAKTFPDLRIILVGRGEGKYVEKLRRRAVSAGYPNLLEFPGFVQHPRLARYLCAAHVFALPSPYEAGPGLVNLEAMACGLPVVACEGTGCAEVVTPGKTGLLVPAGDVAALADALGRLLADESLRTLLGQQAREFAVAEASTTVAVRRVEALYDALSPTTEAT